MKKYLMLLAGLSLQQAYAAFPFATTYKGVQVLQPAPMGQIGANCGYHAVYNGAAALQHVRGGRPLSYRSFTFDRADRDALFNPPGAWGAFAAAQRDPGYAGADNLESEIIRLLIEQFVPEIEDNFVVFDNTQQFLGDKFAKFNAGARTITNTTRAGTTTRTEEVGVEVGRERFWSAVRGMVATHTPFEFLFIINTSQAVHGAIGGGHWVMVLFHKDTAGVHHYYAADTGGNIVHSPLVTAIIDNIENPAGRIASAHEIAWALGGAEEAEEIAQNERIRLEREEEERRVMEETLRASLATAQRPAAAAAYDDEEVARVLSLSVAQERERQEEAQLQQVLQESERLAIRRLQQQQAEEREAVELARALEVSTRLAAQSAEDEEFERVLAVSKQEADTALKERIRKEKERRIAEEQEVLRRAAQAREDAALARAMALSLEEQQIPAHPQGPTIAVRPPVAPRPAAQPQAGAAAVARPPMTVMERLIAQQRAELERLEREKQNKR